MLEIRTRIQVIADGFDPTRGILHADGASGRDAYVFDLMESARPDEEYRILRTLRRQNFIPADLAVSSTGGCRMSPALATALVSDFRAP
ncbi:CRISPR-associated endonuclease Cas1 [Maricaulis salignorans]|uniref:CRISPR-associated endonuclease Cas1 n=1 Tax=Maricaulis salignorans TaxID=144026 RepID=UPI000B819E97